MTVSQAGNFNLQEFTDAGIPLALGRLYTYATGTTTQKIAYTDAAGLVPHTYTLDASDVPYIALNGRGELPAPLYLLADGPYDLALKRPDGSSVWTRRAEGVASAGSIATLYAGSGGSALVGFLQSGTGSAARTAQDKMRERLSTGDQATAGNGVTNDSAKIVNLLAEGTSRNGVTVNLTATASGYGIDRPFVGSQNGLPIPGNVSLKGDNTKLVLLNDSSFIYLGRSQDRSDTTFVSFYGITAGVDYAQITADTTTTTTTIPVNPGDEAAFAIGDLVYVRLGQAAYDSAEPDYFYYAKVLSTASGTVTLDRPTGYALDVDASTTGDVTNGSSTVAAVPGIAAVKPFMTVSGAGIPASTFVGTVSTTSFTLVNSSGTLVPATATNAGTALTIQTTVRQRRIIKMTDIPQNQTIEGLYLQGASSGTPNAEFGIQIRYARNITIRNVSGRDVGPGLIGGQFGENILIENVSLDQCSARGQASKGRMFSFAECQGVTVVNYRAENFAHVMAFIEGGCEQIRFIDGVVVNNTAGKSATDQIFFLAGAQDLHVDGLRIEGNPCTIMQSSTDTKLIPPFLKNVSCSPSFSPTFGTVSRWFDVDHVDENVQMGTWFTFTKRKRYNLELTLLASKAAIQNIPLPFGVYTRIRATLTGKTGVLSLGLSRGTGAAIPVPSAGGLTLVNDMTVNVPFEFPKTSAYPWWLFGSGHPFTNPAIDKYLYYTTDGTLVAGTKVYLELEFFPVATPTILADSVSYQLV